jgi:hypothetical protein
MRLFAGSNLDPNLFSSAIQVAEEKYVREVLSDAFYADFCNQKNKLITTDNITEFQMLINNQNGSGKITLQPGWYFNAIEFCTTAGYNLIWNACLWRYIFECVYAVALPENYAKFTNSGIIRNNPSPGFIDAGTGGGTTAGVTVKDLKYIRDEVRFERLSVMRDAVIRYIHANGSMFPLYPDKWLREKENSKKTAFINIYSEQDRRHPRDYNDGW